MLRGQDSDGAQTVQSVSQPELAGIFTEPLYHGFRQDTAEATSVLSSEATKLAAQGNRDLASGVVFLNLSKCRVYGPPVCSRAHGPYC